MLYDLCSRSCVQPTSRRGLFPCEHVLQRYKPYLAGEAHITCHDGVAVCVTSVPLAQGSAITRGENIMSTCFNNETGTVERHQRAETYMPFSEFLDIGAEDEAEAEHDKDNCHATYPKKEAIHRKITMGNLSSANPRFAPVRVTAGLSVRPGRCEPIRALTEPETGASVAGKRVCYCSTWC